MGKPRKTAQAKPVSLAARICVFFGIAVFALMAFSVSGAFASSGEGKEAGAEGQSAGVALPGNVFELEKVVTTIVLPRQGMIRQFAAGIWLELSSVEHRALVTRIQPKLLNAFMTDIQRYFYRDTKYRAEKVAKGKRGYHYQAPALLLPPKPKLDEDGKEIHEEPAENDAPKAHFSPFKPTTDPIIVGLQRRFLATCNKVLGPDVVTSVQVRGLFDQWPNER
ncbi:hypothetical protein [Thalassospira mesophila]|uniref:hypothetical protein n=1 Tax=Thalassospira mesophila TaxID=1293891 RepID=UPI000A1DDE16|nr:hypothetical protein [Thalassospira mesophila]